LWNQIQKEKELPFSKQIKFKKRRRRKKIKEKRNKRVLSIYSNFPFLANKKKMGVKKQRKRKKGKSLGELGKLRIPKNSHLYSKE